MSFKHLFQIFLINIFIKFIFYKDFKLIDFEYMCLIIFKKIIYKINLEIHQSIKFKTDIV